MSTPPPELLRAVWDRQGKREGKEIRFRCPAPDHADERPSAFLNPEKGVWFCHACKAHGGIVELCRLLEVPMPGERTATTEVTYDYEDETGSLLYQVVRRPGKNFRQRRPDGRGGWIWKLTGVAQVLYQLPSVLGAVKEGKVIWIVEGEKDADRISALGLTATTNSGGAGKWRNEFSASLKGARIAIVPDNDIPGRDHAQKVARALQGLATEVRILNLPDLPAKGDVSDWIAAELKLGKSEDEARADLERLLEETPIWDGRTPAGDSDGEGQDQVQVREVSYEATERGLVHFKETRDGVVSVLLTNFTAHVIGEVIHDDGVEITRSFEIEATLRGRVSRFEVSASRFPGLGWVTEELGPNAVVYAGYSAKDHTRAAIQLLSGDAGSRTVYAHLGWRRVGDHRVYLHGDGAIGPTGTVPGVEVDASGQLSRYALPAPPAGADLARSIRGSLSMLDLLPDEIVLPLYCAIWRATVGPCDFSLHLSGQTGEGKSELAALVQQHFGAEMDSRHLPGSWCSTGNALEALAFAAKDAVLVVDDFAPEGTASDVQRQHREAARVLRAQGNRSGRGRLRRDATLRPGKPPRGLIISTGEDIPKGQSIRARLLVLEVPARGMNWTLLTECQRDAAAGLYAEALAGFVQWLSSGYDDLKERRRRRVAELRDRAMAEGGSHRRTPAIVAELAFGLELFGRFASEARVIDAATADDLLQRGWRALGVTAGRQDEHLRASDPVLRFLELLRSSIASGNAHLASPEGVDPEEPTASGWRRKSIGAGVSECDEWQAQGQRVGWIEGEDVYLEPDAAYRAAQQMATADGPAVTPRTLWKRMHERGVLASRDDARKRSTVRRTLEGARREVLHLKKETLLPQESSQSSQPSHEPGKPRSGGTFPWDGSEVEARKPSQETGPQSLEDRADGTVGPNGTVSVTEGPINLRQLTMPEGEEPVTREVFDE